MFNKGNTSAAYKEDFPYHVTEEVVLHNVTTVSGKPVNLSPNAYMFRNVKVVREVQGGLATSSRLQHRD